MTKLIKFSNSYSEFSIDPAEVVAVFQDVVGGKKDDAVFIRLRNVEQSFQVDGSSRDEVTDLINEARGHGEICAGVCEFQSSCGRRCCQARYHGGSHICDGHGRAP